VAKLLKRIFKYEGQIVSIEQANAGSDFCKTLLRLKLLNKGRSDLVVYFMAAQIKHLLAGI
jgi:hypothetical protein